MAISASRLRAKYTQHRWCAAPHSDRRSALTRPRAGHVRAVALSAVPEDFTPKKIVYAVLLKQGEDLTIDTLFPFSQVTLRRAAVSLEGKAEVEVIPIRMAQPHQQP